MGLPGPLWGWAGGPPHDEQILGGKMGENEKMVVSCAMERGREEEMKTVRNGLMWEAYTPPGAMEVSELCRC